MDITIVKAVFGGLRKTRTAPLYRDDHDLILQLVGVKGLPVHFQAHFANTEYGTAVVMMGSDGEVTIPNSLLATGLPIYCWVIVESGISGRVTYSVQIPVRQKARPNGSITPEQADIISQAISALNDAGTAAQEAADSAAQNAEYVAGIKDDLYEAIDRVGVLEEAKETTLEAAGNAEAWAVGNRGGSAVPSTDPAYHNNSKYYAEQAAESARTLTIDSTLSQPGQAADAKVVGEKLDALTSGEINLLSGLTWAQGSIGVSGKNSNATNRIRIPDYIYAAINISTCDTINIAVETGYKGVCRFYKSDYTILSSVSYTEATIEIVVPENAVYARFVLQKTDDADLLPADGNNLSVYIFTTVRKIAEAVASELTGLNEDISGIADNLERIKGTQIAAEFIFSQGTLNSNTGKYSSNSNRIYTEQAYAIKDGIKIEFDAIFNYSVFFYGANDFSDYKGKTDFIFGVHYVNGTDISIPDGALFIRVVVKYASGNTVPIIPSDIDVSDYSVFILEDYARLTKSDVFALESQIPPCTPNIIYSCREGQVDSLAYPHNSKWAIKACANNEYDRIRFTVRRVPNTADPEETDFTFVCIHDSNINSLARNLDGTAISEQVSSNSPLSVLDSYDWGIQYGAKYAGYKVPKLEEALYYANIYGLGVTLEFNTFLTEEQVQEAFDICVKYNHISNLQVAARNLTISRYWQARSKEISFYIGITEEDIETAALNWAELKTPWNDIYIQVYPLGGVPSANYLDIARCNGLKVCNTQIMSLANLKTYGFNKGVSLIECANIARIKTTVRKYADSLID